MISNHKSSFPSELCGYTLKMITRPLAGALGLALPSGSGKVPS